MHAMIILWSYLDWVSMLLKRVTKTITFSNVIRENLNLILMNEILEIRLLEWYTYTLGDYYILFTYTHNKAFHCHYVNHSLFFILSLFDDSG